MSSAVAGPPPRQPFQIARWLPGGLIAASAVLIGGYAGYPYLIGGESRIALNPAAAMHYMSLVAHGLPGATTLILGPLQFVPALRARWPRAHRLIGRTYMVAVVLAAAFAMAATLYSVNGFSVQVAFLLLTAAWLYTLAQGYLAIRARQIALHRVWMIRNYALTFAAATLRIYLLMGFVVRNTLLSGMDLGQLYAACVWASFTINAVVVEYVVIQRLLRPLARQAARNEEP